MVILISQNGRDIKESLKETIKKKIKEELKQELKQELLDEIYEELLLEENEITKEISNVIAKKKVNKVKPIAKSDLVKIPKELAVKKAEINITVKAVLKIASHALKYANKKISKKNWVEVIGLLSGRMENNILIIEDAYPIGHGDAIHVEMDFTRNRKSGHVRAYEESRKNNLFICGWYHSHPGYTPFISEEDFYTQSEYQKHWDKAIALVIDPYQIDGKSYGFKIFRANLATKKWFEVPVDIRGDLNVKMLPELIDFINPIVDGKAIYLEYDEED